MFFFGTQCIIKTGLKGFEGRQNRKTGFEKYLPVLHSLDVLVLKLRLNFYELDFFLNFLTFSELYSKCFELHDW